MGASSLRAASSYKQSDEEGKQRVSPRITLADHLDAIENWRYKRSEQPAGGFHRNSQTSWRTLRGPFGGACGGPPEALTGEQDEATLGKGKKLSMTGASLEFCQGWTETVMTMTNKPKLAWTCE